MIINANFQIQKGKITLWFTLSSGEFADQEASLLFVKLDNEIRQ